MPAIVDPETFAQAQRLLRRNFAQAKRNARRAYLLRGLITCGLCGRTYVGDGNHARAQFYYRWQKNRYRVRPAEVVRLIEEGKQPVILDTRKSEAYEKLPLKIPGSVRLSPEELDSGVAGLELDLTRPVVAYCT